jgi:hypothetical protein
MRTLFGVLVCFGFVAPGARAAAVVAPYSAFVSDSACVGAKTCVLTFPAVAAGKALTIVHVSCGVATAGESGFLDNAVLSTAKAVKPDVGDHLLFTDFVVGSAGAGVVSQATVFYVGAGDAATITLTAGADITASAGGGCFISGTMN